MTGYFAPTARFGWPDDFKQFVDYLHGRGIGVIVDWVPAHFPRDDWALARFDGTALYEHEHSRGAHPEWGTLIFDLVKGLGDGTSVAADGTSVYTLIDDTSWPSRTSALWSGVSKTVAFAY